MGGMVRVEAARAVADAAPLDWRQGRTWGDTPEAQAAGVGLARAWFALKEAQAAAIAAGLSVWFSELGLHVAAQD